MLGDAVHGTTPRAGIDTARRDADELRRARLTARFTVERIGRCERIVGVRAGGAPARCGRGPAAADRVPYGAAARRARSADAAADGAGRGGLTIRERRADGGLSAAGDEPIPDTDVIMDRAFSVPGRTGRGGRGSSSWVIERRLPAGDRATRRVVKRWQDLALGHVILDCGGRHETVTVAQIEAPDVLVYRSRRGHTDVTWAITPGPVPADTRVSLRLRLAPVKHARLAG